MKIGAQIYSLRKLINNAKDLEAMFLFLAQNNAQAVEMVDFSFAPPSMLKQLSKDYNIEIGSTHTDYDKLMNDTQKVLEEHLEYGCHIVGLGSMPIPKYNINSYNSMMRFCDELTKIAEVADKYGMCIDYHNHAFEFKKVKSLTIMDIIISNTPANVQLCLDIYWAKKAKVDIIEFMNTHKNKINILHFKDYKKTFFGSKYTTVGQGELDIKGIYDLALTNNIQYGYVEHDNPHDPKQVVGDGLKYLLNI